MYAVYFLSSGKWQQSNITFKYSREGRSGLFGTVHMSPTAWAQCDFPSLRHAGQWKVKKL